MAQPRFGTDGIRGRAPEDLTVDLARLVARASARVLNPENVVIGRDTRASGPDLVEGLIDGFLQEGVDVLDVGVLPTPGVAYISALKACPGIVVSASHNPYSDNGIKVFGVGGTKLSVEQEVAIERELERLSQDAGATSKDRGTFLRDESLIDTYLDHVVGTVNDGALGGMTIALDCAHGASVRTAEIIFARLGATVVQMGDKPTGTNINDQVGSTHPEALAALVVRSGADLGLAFDGDADRVVTIDHTGSVIDGDTLVALFAQDFESRGILNASTVVVTVMSNLGFHRAMKRIGVSVRTVGVGDRNVVEAIDEENLSLGGEQSGHIIFRALATTGDGVLSGVLLADLVQRSNASLAVLSAGTLTLVPQYLEAVIVDPASDVDAADELWSRIHELETELGDRGRILVRASGTEPVIRVMVEADDDSEAQKLTQELVTLVKTTLGSPGEQEGL